MKCLAGLEDENTHAVVRYDKLCFSFGGSNYFTSRTITNYDEVECGLNAAVDPLVDWELSQETNTILGLSYHRISEYIYPNISLISNLEDLLDKRVCEYIKPKDLVKSYDWKTFQVYLIDVTIKINKDSVNILNFSCTEIKDTTSFDTPLMKNVGVERTKLLENEPLIYNFLLPTKSKKLNNFCCSLREKINHFLHLSNCDHQELCQDRVVHQDS